MDASFEMAHPTLVGGWATPLKNISQLGWLFPIYGKIKNVPNHQPVLKYGCFGGTPILGHSILKTHYYNHLQTQVCGGRTSWAKMTLELLEPQLNTTLWAWLPNEYGIFAVLYLSLGSSWSSWRRPKMRVSPKHPVGDPLSHPGRSDTKTLGALQLASAPGGQARQRCGRTNSWIVWKGKLMLKWADWELLYTYN